jgi:hypothetical protein
VSDIAMGIKKEWNPKRYNYVFLDHGPPNFLSIYKTYSQKLFKYCPPAFFKKVDVDNATNVQSGSMKL